MALLCSVTGLFLIGCKPVGSPSRGTVDTGRGVKVELKVATCQPTNLPGLGDAILGVAKRVHEMTAGRIELDVQEPGAIVPALEVLDAVSSGTVGGGFGPAGFWAGKMPAAPLFSAVPFGPEAGEYIAWMYHGDGLALEQRMYSEAGFQVVALPCALLAAETSGWFQKPVDTAEDLRGLKMRFYGLGGQVMQELGVAVTVMGGEIYQAAEKNVWMQQNFLCQLLMKSSGSLVLRSTTTILDGISRQLFSNCLLIKIFGTHYQKSISRSSQTPVKLQCLIVLRNQRLFRQMPFVEILMKEVLRIVYGLKRCSIFMRRHGMPLHHVRHRKMHFSKRCGRIYSLFEAITENGVAVLSCPAEKHQLIKLMRG